MNLGSQFLCTNKINLLLDRNLLSFRGEKVNLNNGNTKKIINEVHKIPVFSSDLIQELPDKPDLPGINLGKNGSGELRAQGFNCRLSEKTDVYPGGTII